MYQNLYQKVGLSKPESKVYEALIRLKAATPAEVTKLSKIRREHTYYILRKLAKLGLVRQDPDAKQQRFELVRPDAFEQILQGQHRQLNLAGGELEQLTSVIQRKLEVTESSIFVRYYVDVAGIKQGYLDFLRGLEGKEQIGVINYHWQGGLEGYFLGERLKHNVSLRMVIADTERGRQLAAKDSKENRQTKIVPDNGFPASTCIYALGHRVMFISQQAQQEHMAVVIENAVLTKAITAMFKLIWDMADFQKSLNAAKVT